MSIAWFCAFLTLPAGITAPGQYRTRGGEVVTVERVSTRHEFGCKGTYSTGQRDGWHKTGRLYFGMLSNNDIVSPA